MTWWSVTNVALQYTKVTPFADSIVVSFWNGLSQVAMVFLKKRTISLTMAPTCHPLPQCLGFVMPANLG